MVTEGLWLLWLRYERVVTRALLACLPLWVEIQGLPLVAYRLFTNRGVTVYDLFAAERQVPRVGEGAGAPQQPEILQEPEQPQAIPLGGIDRAAVYRERAWPGRSGSATRSVEDGAKPDRY